MTEMPLLGRTARRPRRNLARIGLALALLAAAGYAGWRYLVPHAAPEARAPAPSPAAPAPAAAPATQPPPPPPPTPDELLRKAGMRYVRAVVAGPLETAFVTQVGRDLGEPLTQVVTRLLVWWVSVPDDLRKDDTIEALFSEREGAEPLVHAVRFKSAKAGRTFAAYRFQAPGAPFAHYYTPDGQELELRLRDAPLDDHDQVTSLIRDGRGHKGVDFRTPVGSPVKATFDAVVVRKNWGFNMNGNCLELREEGGARRSVYFLHLSEPPEVRVGERVRKGQVVAKSGNTGHSFAPHLHYQLVSSSGTILDPFAVQDTVRRALPDAAKAAFDEEVKRLDDLLAKGAAGK